jgi:pyruvate carboxylase
MLMESRGEIAIRILSSARELGFHTIAIYTSDDANHAAFAQEAVLLDSPSDFTNAARILEICRSVKADSLHPGYGFLSENADFAEMMEKAGVVFIGPSSQILRQTSDKTQARLLAEANDVPCLPASTQAFSSSADARGFIDSLRFPIMIKAVDGGGGRGIRLVERPEDLDSNISRACGESPSGKVFIEQAAVDGFRHVEVQILGDNHGTVAHLWERECSIQRRFQKMIELAPSTIQDRGLINKIIDGALRMARAIHYTSLGTFEFLVHDSSSEYYFLEVNPRLQVEHTITEEISNIDLVRSQLLLAQGARIEVLKLPSQGAGIIQGPKMCAIQLRITAEDVTKGFSLSMGRITQVHWPGGQGIRVDTHLSGLKPTQVRSAYDSLLAKIIVRSSSFETTRVKALRALADTSIKGVQTNIPVLAAVVSSTDFQAKGCSTQWLEANLTALVRSHGAFEKESISGRLTGIKSIENDSATGGAAGLGSGSILFRKGDAFKINLSNLQNSESSQDEHLLRLDRILVNDFPNSIMADISFLSANSGTGKYAASISMSTSKSVASSRHRKGDSSDRSHVCLPFPGQFVELLVDEGDQVSEGDLLCVVRQMKMELEVRAPYSARVTWVCDVEDGETVNDGLLVCTLQQLDGIQKAPERREIAAKL